jgi:hypothetical protein
MAAEKRLRFYARQFPLVEVDATYYALPGEQTAKAWAERTPDRFTFNIKAFSLFTQHPTPVRALPAGLREAASQAGKDRVYLKASTRPSPIRRGTGSWPPWSRYAAPGSSARSCCSSRRGSLYNCYGNDAHVNAQQLSALVSS